MTPTPHQSRPPRRVFTYANVLATAALLTAVTGVGVAADATVPQRVITKMSQIKPSVVAKLRSAAGAPGPAGPVGAAGQAGPQGLPGARGPDATGPVPAGRTITGAYYVLGTVEAVHTFALPMPLATRVSSAAANFAADASTATTDDDATCVGTFANPTAPAGKFCVYSVSMGGVTAASVESFSEPGLRDRGIFMLMSLSGTAASYFGTWAYTAP